MNDTIVGQQTGDPGRLIVKNLALPRDDFCRRRRSSSSGSHQSIQIAALDNRRVQRMLAVICIIVVVGTVRPYMAGLGWLGLVVRFGTVVRK
jgi:hypothetical protein